MRPEDLARELDSVAEELGLSGAVRIDLDGVTVVERAWGWADRAHRVAATAGHRYGVASGAKSFTALTVMSMVDRGELALEDPVRPVLGADLPLIDDRVTIEHLLAHRSGIGDYLDESLPTQSDDYVLAVPAHRLDATEAYLAVLGGHATKFEPDGRFEYCNGGYVVLALVAERVARVPFPELVAERVCAPAGLGSTGFLRSDELPGDAARGYVFGDGLRTNVMHLPVRGSGDGGIYTTLGDVHRLWDACVAGRVVRPETWAEMTRPRSEVPEDSARYGLGFWLGGVGDAVSMHGFDTGVGFVSTLDPERRATWSVVANQSAGAWPASRRIEELVAALRR